MKPNDHEMALEQEKQGKGSADLPNDCMCIWSLKIFLRWSFWLFHSFLIFSVISIYESLNVQLIFFACQTLFSLLSCSNTSDVHCRRRLFGAEGICLRASQRLLARPCQAEARCSLRKTAPVRGVPMVQIQCKQCMLAAVRLFP